MFYILAVVGRDTYSMYTKLGGGTNSAHRYVCKNITQSPSVAATSFFIGMFPKNWTKQEEKWTIQKNTKKQK